MTDDVSEYIEENFGDIDEFDERSKQLIIDIILQFFVKDLGLE